MTDNPPHRSFILYSTLGRASFFFFSSRRRHTRLVSDWSSDVCSSDLAMSFANAHSYERMADPKVRAVKERVELVADRKLMDPDAPRGGLVEVTLRNGKTDRKSVV